MFLARATRKFGGCVPRDMSGKQLLTIEAADVVVLNVQDRIAKRNTLNKKINVIKRTSKV